LLEHSFGPGDTTLRVNTTKIATQAFAERLDAQPVEGLPGALRLPPRRACDAKAGEGSISGLPGYAEGLFHVQDAAAQLCCQMLDPQPGELVLDLCAAPGGKSFTCAELMRNQGRVIALDLHAHRVKLIEQGAARLGLACIEAMRGDARQMDRLFRGKAQRVLCDVPCSGLGTIQKKPDIREKSAKELDKLPEMQYDILCGGLRCLAPGGTLVYATCTLNPAENEAVCERFLTQHPDFRAEYRTLMPHIDGTDGFFIARFYQ